MGFQLPVQLVKNDPRLDKAAPGRDIKVENAVQMAAGVDHKRVVHRLPALRGAAAARQDGHALGPRESQRRLDILQAFRHHHTMRHHLVDRGIGGIAPAREIIVEQAAAKLGLQRGKGGDADIVRHETLDERTENTVDSGIASRLARGLLSP